MQKKLLKLGEILVKEVYKRKRRMHWSVQWYKEGDHSAKHHMQNLKSHSEAKM
jgi:hypothetical protein